MLVLYNAMETCHYVGLNLAVSCWFFIVQSKHDIVWA